MSSFGSDTALPSRLGCSSERLEESSHRLHVPVQVALLGHPGNFGILATLALPFSVLLEAGGPILIILGRVSVYKYRDSAE